MTKILITDGSRCTGCRLCELVCSVTKEGVSDPSLARVRVDKWEMGGTCLPLFCRHCEDPLCAMVCPVNGIRRDSDLGRVVVDEDRCVGCQSCVSSCPLGNLRFDGTRKAVLRCDLCGGDPACVKVCSTGAIQYLDHQRISEQKKAFAAKGLQVVLKMP